MGKLQWRGLITPAVILLIGLVAIWDGVQLILRYQTNLRVWEAGGYEIVVGLVLACLAPFARAKEAQQPAEPGLGHEASARSVAGAVALLFAYVLAMPLLGYLLATFLVLVAYLRIYGHYGWGALLVYSGVAAIGSAWGLATLAIRMPSGFIPWP